jgi:AraC-like DNA-binding protein
MHENIPPRTPSDPLGDALHLLRMRGAFYCRTEAFAPWGLEVPPFPDAVSFHVITEGSCWLEAPESDPTHLLPGDMALVPHGRGHALRSAPEVAVSGRVDQLPQHFVTEHYSVLTHGRGDAVTRMFCGIVTFDEPAARSLVDGLPPLIHVGATAPTSPASIHDAIRMMATELQDLRPGGEAVTIRLADILVVQAIRAWLTTDPAAQTGWLGALRDDRIGRALAALHRDPGRDWTLESLAAEASMSRSSFAARFTDLVGEPAMAYLTRWRMQVAHDRLRSGDATVSRIAGELGYRSEAAFSRAFTRTVGHTPGSVRRRPSAAHQAARSPAAPRT